MPLTYTTRCGSREIQRSASSPVSLHSTSSEHEPNPTDSPTTARSVRQSHGYSSSYVNMRKNKKTNHLALAILFGMFAYWANHNRHYHDEHTIDLVVMIVFGILSIYQFFLLSQSLRKEVK